MLTNVDVLIVGAGLSGIGAACHLQRRCPGKTYVILETRDAIGGTWDLFRYPGIRSDSDMFTLGYRFRPWPKPESIADGASIRDYIRDTARDHGVERHIRFHHRVEHASWSSETARWTVRARRTDTGETVSVTCSFLFCCAGTYRSDQGYTPPFDGVGDYHGTIIHPQHWPSDVDYTGKRVTVIGSGATAVTLVPALAEQAAHVTMVQRSPTYVIALPSRDPVADFLRRWLPVRAAYSLVRWKNVVLGAAFFRLSRRRPDTVKRLIRRGLTAQLPDGYDIQTHFTPRYNPWDQRMCLAPDADLFRALRRGTVSIVTDRIETFTEKGLRLASGTELESDIIVTATGLVLVPVGGLRLTVDGADVDVAKTVAYKGVMLSGVPNFALTIGYTNASWTLKSDLVAAYVGRLLSYMDRHGFAACTPLPPPSPDRMPLIDFSSGYIQRATADLPKQGARAPWRLYQNYVRDVVMMRHRSVADEGVRFS